MKRIGTQTFSILRTLSLIIAVLEGVHLTAMEKEVKDIGSNDLPALQITLNGQAAQQLTFHQFPELPAETQQEVLSRFIPDDLAQSENVLAVLKRIAELMGVNTKFATTLIECFKNPVFLEQAIKGHIHHRLLCRDKVLRTISRALIKDRFLATARSILERKPIKNVEKLLVRTMSKLQTELKTDYPLAANEYASLTNSAVTKFQDIFDPALEELCPEIVLLA